MGIPCNKLYIISIGSLLPECTVKRGGTCSVAHIRTHRAQVQEGVDSQSWYVGIYLCVYKGKVAKLLFIAVFEILVEFVQCKEWKLAFEQVIPLRKQATASGHSPHSHTTSPGHQSPHSDNGPPHTTSPGHQSPHSDSGPPHTTSPGHQSPHSENSPPHTTSPCSNTHSPHTTLSDPKSPHSDNHPPQSKGSPPHNTLTSPQHDSCIPHSTPYDSNLPHAHSKRQSTP